MGTRDLAPSEPVVRVVYEAYEKTPFGPHTIQENCQTEDEALAALQRYAAKAVENGEIQRDGNPRVLKTRGREMIGSVPKKVVGHATTYVMEDSGRLKKIPTEDDDVPFHR